MCIPPLALLYVQQGLALPRAHLHRLQHQQHRKHAASAEPADGSGTCTAPISRRVQDAQGLKREALLHLVLLHIGQAVPHLNGVRYTRQLSFKNELRCSSFIAHQLVAAEHAVRVRLALCRVVMVCTHQLRNDTIRVLGAVGIEGRRPHSTTDATAIIGCDEYIGYIGCDEIGHCMRRPSHAALPRPPPAAPLLPLQHQGKQQAA